MFDNMEMGEGEHMFEISVNVNTGGWVLIQFVKTTMAKKLITSLN